MGKKHGQNEAQKYLDQSSFQADGRAITEPGKGKIPRSPEHTRWRLDILTFWD
jgi:hypothetical protein